MNHLDLFSGIGGFTLAADWVWGEDHYIHAFIEIDPYCQKILKKHWPKVLIIDDIRNYKHDGTKIDLLTGGFPCQPFSQAGSRKGTEDNRYLWPAMFEIIRQARPTWIIGENVAGILSMVQFGGSVKMASKKGFFIQKGEIFEREGSNIFWGDGGIIENLESEGYSVETFVLPACAIDAPHRRDRVWVIANSESNDGDNIGMQNNGNRSSAKKFRRCFGDESKPKLCRVDDGISGELDRLRALGNAIIPQVVVPIMQAIKEIMELE